MIATPGPRTPASGPVARAQKEPGRGRSARLVLRIVAGAWRGRALVVPAGTVTRPTADRVRQALFDMLMHAPWAPADGVRGLSVLDAFAGTGALGLEALSRGAAEATFLEHDRTALAALRTNVLACGAETARVVEADAFRPPAADKPAGLVFLDPPYGQDAPARAVRALGAAGWIGAGTLVVVETGRDETAEVGLHALAERRHGAACVRVFSVDERAI